MRGSLAGVCAAAVVLASLLAACGEESAGQAEFWQRQGQLLAWDGDVWIVDAVPIIVPAATSVNGERTLGSQVSAAGSYDERGRMVAHSITLTNGSLPNATLDETTHEGVIDSVSDTGWVVDGVAIVLSDGVGISAAEGVDPASLAVAGNVAAVTGYRFGDGTIIATQIVVSATPEEPGPNTAPHPGVTVEQQPDARDGDDDDGDDDADDDDDKDKDRKPDEKDRDKKKDDEDRD